MRDVVRCILGDMHRVHSPLRLHWLINGPRSVVRAVHLRPLFTLSLSIHGYLLFRPLVVIVQRRLATRVFEVVWKLRWYKHGTVHRVGTIGGRGNESTDFPSGAKLSGIGHGRCSGRVFGQVI